MSHHLLTSTVLQSLLLLWVVIISVWLALAADAFLCPCLSVISRVCQVRSRLSSLRLSIFVSSGFALAADNFLWSFLSVISRACAEYLQGLKSRASCIEDIQRLMSHALCVEDDSGFILRALCNYEGSMVPSFACFDCTDYDPCILRCGGKRWSQDLGPFQNLPGMHHMRCVCVQIQDKLAVFNSLAVRFDAWR